MNVTKSKEQRCAYLCPQVEVLEMEIEAMITTSPGAGAGGGAAYPYAGEARFLRRRRGGIVIISEGLELS